MVRPENERARALYEARGFTVVPRMLMTKLLAS
jgi:ribosomal protein S18 acetylase RimI-like enzyme